MVIDEQLATIGAAFVGGIAGLYGGIQSWLTRRKTRQLTLEMLMTKLDMDFKYETYEIDDHKKVLHGIVTLKNLGNTNIRIPEFRIEGEDRAKQFAKAYQGDDYSAANTYEFQRFGGVNNSHLVKFGRRNSRSYFISYNDNIYTQREGRVRVLDMSSNISSYILANLIISQT